MHVDRRVALCMEQFIRMLNYVGLPEEDIDVCWGGASEPRTGLAVNAA